MNQIARDVFYGLPSEKQHNIIIELLFKKFLCMQGEHTLRILNKNTQHLFHIYYDAGI